MKNIYVALLSLLLSTSAMSQGYYPMLDSISNIWYYSLNVVPVRATQNTSVNCNYGAASFSNANTFSTIGDTTLNTFDYKKLQYEEYLNAGSDCIYGFLREDTTTKKIYFQDHLGGIEELIYDFSMQPGDSIYLDFYENFGYYHDGYFVLDSISTIAIHSGQRKLFFLNNHQFPTMFPLEWIESVGHPGHLVYTRSGNNWGGLYMWACMDPIARDFYQTLTCFEHASQKVYFDSCAHALAYNNWCFNYADSCYYWNICGSVPDLGAISSFTINPNPVRYNSEVVIQANRKSHAQILIYSNEGRQLFSSKNLSINPGTNKFPLQTYNYRHGIYVMELRFETGSLFKKMVVIN